MYHGMTVLCLAVQLNVGKITACGKHYRMVQFFLLSALVTVKSKITKTAKGNINFSATGSKGNCNIKIV